MQSSWWHSHVHLDSFEGSGGRACCNISPGKGQKWRDATNHAARLPRARKCPDPYTTTQASRNTFRCSDGWQNHHNLAKAMPMCKHPCSPSHAARQGVSPLFVAGRQPKEAFFGRASAISAARCVHSALGKFPHTVPQYADPPCQDLPCRA